MPREAFVVQLAQLRGLQPATSATQTFSDVPASDPNFGWVMAARLAGWISGFPGGSFDPNGTLTREQAAKLEVIALGLQVQAQALAGETPDYHDAGIIGRWAWGYVNEATAVGILHGLADGSFGPSSAFTSAQANDALTQLQAYLKAHARPVVTAVSPADGSQAGGTQVAIIGTGLAGATAVNFGPAAASSFTVNSDDSISAVSPAGSGTVDITVVTPNGTSALSTEDRFSYTTLPQRPVAPLAPSLSPAPAAAASRDRAGDTTITAAAASGDTLTVVVSSISIATPAGGSRAPASGGGVTTQYASGADLAAAAGDYVGVYDVNSAGDIVAFSRVGPLTATDIGALVPTTASLSAVAPAGGTSGTTSIEGSANSTGDTLRVQVVSSSTPWPLVGSAPPAGTSGYIIGSPLAVSAGQYVDIYELGGGGQTTAFQEFQITAANMDGPAATATGLAYAFPDLMVPGSGSVTDAVTTLPTVEDAVGHTLAEAGSYGISGPDTTDVTVDQSGQITVPSGATAGSYQATYTQGTAIDQVPITLDPTLQVATGSLPDGAVGTSYDETLQATGGIPPYTWHMGTGLPPGLTVDSSTGEMTGTPKQSGSFGFSAFVTDAQGDATDPVGLAIVVPPDFDTFGFQGVGSQSTQVTGGLLVTVPYGTNITSLVADFTPCDSRVTATIGGVTQVSGTTVNNFSSPVTYLLESADGTQASVTITVVVAPSSDTFIQDTALDNHAYVISTDNTSGALGVLAKPGTTALDLQGAIQSTDGSTQTYALQDSGGGPVSDSTLLETGDVLVVTAADHSTTADYAVTVASTDTTITSFSFDGLTPAVNGTIDGSSITLAVPSGTDVTALVPTITVSPNASVSPASGTAENFTSPVTYTVTAQDTVTQADYTVTVNFLAPAIASISAAPGSTLGTTAITVQPNQSGDTFLEQVVSSPTQTPIVGATPPEGAATYISGSDLATALYEFVDVYEVSGGAIQAFSEIPIDETNFDYLQATVVSSVDTVAADGISSATITVTVEDSFGHPVQGENVALYDYGASSSITPVSVTTGSDGVATFTVSDAQVEGVSYEPEVTIGGNPQGIGHAVAVGFTPYLTAATYSDGTLTLDFSGEVANIMNLVPGDFTLAGGGSLGTVDTTYSGSGTSELSIPLSGASITPGTTTINIAADETDLLDAQGWGIAPSFSAVTIEP